MDIDLFNYNLPNELIAQSPLSEREKARMLVLDKNTGKTKHDYFYNIIDYLKAGDVLVINDSKVMKCRLFGEKEKTSAGIECFILKKISDKKALVLLKPFKRLSRETKVFLSRENNVFFIVEKKMEDGRALAGFNKNVSDIISSYGVMPLPPYIRNREFDENFYQTIYAKSEGSTAAPTAGLHFTKKILRQLKKNEIMIARVRLNIGLDTFKPVKEKDIENHKIHSEEFSITAANVRKIEHSIKKGGKVVAVGTTTVRVLETIMSRFGRLKAYKGNTDLFIYPGYDFKIVDKIITNFHLPKSTLIAMISAFAGRESLMNAYEEAIREKYRFYSLGDCMLIQ
ncbi:MAG TPA: tRNA preQ1(34) S-adenosylmethionine ribosyltransferase-isomerase QueA [Actinobacteria bacterium]|nr:tRNA preQ1(34) S-adenosylmethionine ribosyltransferase-isomerase QueA [Actinomycetota bacterium]